MNKLKLKLKCVVDKNYSSMARIMAASSALEIEIEPVCPIENSSSRVAYLFNQIIRSLSNRNDNNNNNDRQPNLHSAYTPTSETIMSSPIVLPKR